MTSLQPRFRRLNIFWKQRIRRRRCPRWLPVWALVAVLSPKCEKSDRKGLLEKYHLSGNRKDIYVKPSAKGREVYTKYTAFVRELCFDDIFKLADQITEADKKLYSHHGSVRRCTRLVR